MSALGSQYGRLGLACGTTPSVNEEEDKEDENEDEDEDVRAFDDVSAAGGAGSCFVSSNDLGSGVYTGTASTGSRTLAFLRSIPAARGPPGGADLGARLKGEDACGARGGFTVSGGGT